MDVADLIRRFTQAHGDASEQEAAASTAMAPFVSGLARHIGGGVADMATFPGRVASGEVPYYGPGGRDNPEMVDWSNNMALSMVGAPKPPVSGPALGSGLLRFREPVEPIRAYHGSKYNFDRFDTSKIGTGEGAQVFGHGLYFAENPEVAAGYRHRLAGDPTVSIDMGAGVPPPTMADKMGVINSPSPNMQARMLAGDYADALPSSGSYLDNVRRRTMQASADSTVRSAATGDSIESEMVHYLSMFPKEVHPQLKQWWLESHDTIAPMVKVERPGASYEVAINARPEQLLDYDRAIREQPDLVRRLHEVAPVGRNRGFVPPTADTTSLGLRAMEEGPTSWYAMQKRAIDSMLEQPGRHFIPQSGPSAQAFRDAGIPGIRYLDSESRPYTGGKLTGINESESGWRPNIENRGETVANVPFFDTRAEARNWAHEKINSGTRNYVMFDDKLIDIIRKFGLAGLPAAGIVAGATQGAQPTE